MASVNENFLKLKQNYLFAEIDKRVSDFIKANPEKKIVKLGIGDVTLPLPPVCVAAMHKAVDEMSLAETFRGYAPYAGYEFLRKAIVRGDFAQRGINVDVDEIFVNEGAKSDTANFGELFSADCVAAVSDPVYPVYFDTSVLSGKEVRFIPCREEDDFAPLPPDFHADLVYLCSPNNPTGSVLRREHLKAWVDYALANDAVLLFDAAYERFIMQEDVPHSIYEINGARDCAVEFRSFSKTAGFTGVRCGYTVIPKGVTAKSADGSRVELNALWLRRQGSKFNGTSYITQRGAEAVYTEEGRAQVMQNICFYLENARIIREGLSAGGFSCSGGVNAPYVWMKCPNGLSSWQLFDELLNRVAVVGTPGAGFGNAGEGYFRLTAFGSREDTIEAVSRLKKAF